jgi:tetratricopeptide (TPR) repeat protein
LFFFLLLFPFPGQGTPKAPPKADEFQKQKAQILIDLGLKKQRQGQVEEAVAAFDDALEQFPGDSYPLLLKARVYCHFGVFNRAEATLASISPDLLNPARKVLFYHLQARTAVAGESLEGAAVAFGQVLKLQADESSAVIRLALINECFGNSKRVDELLDRLKDLSAIDCHDLALVLVIRLFHGDLGKSFEAAGFLAAKMGTATFHDEGKPAMFLLWQNTIGLWLGSLYLMFGTFIGFFYLILLLGLLVMLAAQFTPENSFSIDVIFVIAAFLHFFLFWRIGIPEARVTMLADHFNFHSPAWIIPRLLCGIHLITLGLFLIIPSFQILPQRLRPQRTELYSIWFFCWWFMLFVLIFQSRLAMSTQLPLLVISFLVAATASLFMPMGRFLLFIIAQKVGLGSKLGLSEELLEGSTSFTDGKILEARAQHLLDAEEFDQVMTVARKVFTSFPAKSFPALSVTLAKAQIEMEDFFEAERTIQGFLESTPDSAIKDSGLLVSAFLRSLKGDHAGALSIINGFSSERAHAFAAEHVAWSLYILARCNRYFNNPVQAHIDFSKALPSARAPLTKARIIAGLTAMDLEMNRKEWAQKWLTESKTVRGGKKSQSFVKTIESLILASQGATEEALKKAQEACCLFERNSFAMAWHGRLLCRMGRHSEAEHLLEKMTPGTDDAERLLQDVTRKS